MTIKGIVEDIDYERAQLITRIDELEEELELCKAELADLEKRRSGLYDAFEES